LLHERVFILLQAARQQLERLPRRQAQATGNSAVGMPVSSNPLSAVAAMTGASANHSGLADHLGAASGHSSSQASSQFLLARLVFIIQC
jgi:hypothetical protein